MELQQSDIIKAKFKGLMKKSTFAEAYGQGVSTSAVTYAMDKGHIDWVDVSGEQVVVLTAKTLEYAPNQHPKRTATMHAEK